MGRFLKTRTWILILAGVFLLLAGIALWQHSGTKKAARAEIWVDGELRESVDLTVERTFLVESGRGWNRVAVKDGKISVLEASCPDGDCVRCGAKNSGAPIVCLPNRLSIRFTEADDGDGVDGVVR